MTEGFVVVFWRDAAHFPGWHGADDVADIAAGKGDEMITVGWMVDKTQAAVVIAMTSSEYKWGDLLRIPLTYVQRIAALVPEDGLLPLPEWLVGERAPTGTEGR